MRYINQVVMYVGGTLFGFGLAFSGVARPEIVLSFLNLHDFGIIIVIGTALLIMLFVIQIVPMILKKPVFGEFFDGHDGFPVTRKAVIGAVIFGIGWGVSGICPATSFAAVGMGNLIVGVGIAGMFLGALLYGHVQSRIPEEHT